MKKDHDTIKWLKSQSRRHSNNKGKRQVGKGKTYNQVKRMGQKAGGSLQTLIFRGAVDGCRHASVQGAQALAQVLSVSD